MVSPSSDITLAVHLEPSKLARLAFSLRHWTGPASVAILLNNEQELFSFGSFLEKNVSVASFPVTFHLMVERMVAENTYPFNILRELALQQVKSKYFLALDVDFFVPSVNHYHEMRSLVENTVEIQEALSEKTFFVLPAFDLQMIVDDSELNSLSYNVTRQDALRLLEEGVIKPFHVSNVKDRSGGYGPTMYDKWIGRPLNNSFYPIRYIVRFEPYVLGERSSSLPHYWPIFRGVGVNKFSWFVEANCCGYKFDALYDYFVLHLGHTKK